MLKHFGLTQIKRYVLASAFLLTACSNAPFQSPVRKSKAADANASSDPSPRGQGDSTSKPVVKPSPPTSTTSTPPTVPTTQGPSTGTVGKSAEEIAAQQAKDEAAKSQGAKDAAHAALERVPEGCTGKGSVTDKDLVLFNGEDIKFDANSKSIALNQGWKIDGYWGNGRIGVEKKRNQSALFFDNETFYHGFDITPASENGKRKTFTMKGFDVYYDSSKSNAATFGLRIIKPGENEGAGDNEKRSWFKLDAAGAGKDADMANAKIDGGTCKLTQFYTSKVFLDQNLVSNRFIWELMTNWDPADKLYVYKIVVKDFRWK